MARKRDGDKCMEFRKKKIKTGMKKIGAMKIERRRENEGVEKMTREKTGWQRKIVGKEGRMEKR